MFYLKCIRTKCHQVYRMFLFNVDTTQRGCSLRQGSRSCKTIDTCQHRQLVQTHMWTDGCCGCAGLRVHNFEEAAQLCKAGQTRPNCRADRATKISIDLIVAVAILYFALTCYILMYKLRLYKKQPYEEIQVAVVFYRLQVIVFLSIPLPACSKVAVKLYQSCVCQGCMGCIA